MPGPGDTPKSRRVVEEFIIPKCSSKAFVVKKEQVLRVIAHEGKQVADIRFLNAHDPREQFSSRVSVSMNRRKRIGGLKNIKELYSKLPWQRLMLRVIDDKVARHLFSGQCEPMHYEMLGQQGHISCAELFDECLKPYHISMRDLDSASVFNVFMVADYIDDQFGTERFDRPACEKADYIDFLAEMDVLVAATSCPDDSIVNDYEPKAMKYQIFE